MEPLVQFSLVGLGWVDQIKSLLIERNIARPTTSRDMCTKDQELIPRGTQMAYVWFIQGERIEG